MSVLQPRRNRGRVLGTALGLSILSAAAGAHGDPAVVEDLIRKGNEHRTKGEDQWALPLFQKAYDIERSPRTAAQLGLVEAALGYWLASERHLQEALTSTRNPWLLRFEKQIRTTLAHVQASIGEVMVTGSPHGAEVLVNGQPAGVIPLGQPVRVGEGAVQVTLRAPGHKESSSHAKVSGGQRVTVTVDLERASPGPAAAPTTSKAKPVPTAGEGVTERQNTGQPAREPDTGSQPFWVRPASWVAAVGAVAALGVGAYGLQTQRTKGEAFDNYTGGSPTKICGASRPDKGGPACKSLYDQAQTGQRLMIGGFAVGGARAAASIVGFVAAAANVANREEVARAHPAIGGDRTTMRHDRTLRF
jgi:hypothetical protein